MKKIIIGLAVIAATAAVNAASIAWKIQNVSTYDSESTKVAKDANYLIVALYSADTTISADLSSGTASYGSDVVISTFAPSASGGTGTTGKKLEYDYAAGTYYYVVLFNSKGTTTASAYDYYAIGQALTGNPAAVSPDTPLALAWQASAYGYTSYTATAVPEPTSGLLLLLGVAGIALKRKRA